MIWLIFGLMLLAAVAVVAWPLVQHRNGLSMYAVAAILFVLASSASLYAVIGTPEGKSAGAEMASIEEMVAGLDQRLRENPDNLAGWKMLGRSYIELQRFDEAVAALEHAVQIEVGSNGQTLVDLGLAVLSQESATSTQRAGELFENAIKVSPNNPNALFYSGLLASERGERYLAADRWEALLATSPPQEIQEILRQKIAELRGEAASLPQVQAAAIVSAAIELAPAVASAMDPNTTVFVIARDPAQPRPPIAVVRRRVGDFPTVIGLSDADAMMPSRLLSGLFEFEIVARVSMTGQPIAQPGDWYGQVTVRPSETREVSIIIDSAVQ